MSSHDEPIDPAVRPGEVLGGKYRVDRVIGAGGMGVVVAARNLQLDDPVALKFLRRATLGSADAVARFVREARAAVKVKSEHVARVLDVCQLEDGTPYIVMEYLEGDDLSEWLDRHGALPADRAVDFVLQACEAIAEAHSLGIVHRDLKPANLFCVQRPDGQLSVKVLDFGISKVTTSGDRGRELTRTGVLIGSPPYMSPEQLQLAKGVDERTDIWSLGIILFELLTRRTPFTSDTATDLAIKIVNEPAPSLRDLRPDAPAGLESVVATCLEKERGRRFASVAELAVALGPFGTRFAQRSVEAVLGTLRQVSASGEAPLLLVAKQPDLGTAATEPFEATGTTTPWRRATALTGPRRGTLAALAAGGALCALAAVGAMALRAAAARTTARGTPTSSPSASAPTAASAPLAPAFAPTPEPPARSGEPRSPTVDVSDLPTARAPLPSTSSRGPALRAGAGATPAAVEPARTLSTAVSPSCKPPYVIDSAGHHVYKTECLQR
jgi:serine/threonine-protein kinase